MERLLKRLLTAGYALAILLGLAALAYTPGPVAPQQCRPRAAPVSREVAGERDR